MHYSNIFSTNETWISPTPDSYKRSLILPSWYSTGPANKLQFLIHYFAVLFILIIWIKLLLPSPQLSVKSFSIPYLLNSIYIYILIWIHILHLHNISVISMGATLALLMFIFLWQPVSLHSTIKMLVILCWWIHTSWNIYQMLIIMLGTVRWLISCIWHGSVIYKFV